MIHSFFILLGYILLILVMQQSCEISNKNAIQNRPICGTETWWTLKAFSPVLPSGVSRALHFKSPSGALRQMRVSVVNEEAITMPWAGFNFPFSLSLYSHISKHSSCSSSPARGELLVRDWHFWAGLVAPRLTELGQEHSSSDSQSCCPRGRTAGKRGEPGGKRPLALSWKK